jgi:hypothetical protein
MERFGPVEKEFRPSWPFLFGCLSVLGFFAVSSGCFFLAGAEATFGNATENPKGAGRIVGSCALLVFLPSLFLMVAVIRSRHRRVRLHRDGIVVKEPNSRYWWWNDGGRPAVIAPGINGLLWADVQDAVAWQYIGDELPHRLKLSGPPGPVCLELDFYSESTLLTKTLLNILEQRHIPLRIEWKEQPKSD